MLASSYLLLFTALLFSLCTPFQATAESTFWEHWGDGKAEVSTYTLTHRRYGELRNGQAIMIWVTEDFSTTKQVKTDDPSAHDTPQSLVPVLKSIQLRRFPTGIYDYSVMAVVFSPVQSWRDGETTHPRQRPIKISYSSQEWCGTIYQQINAKKTHYSAALHSYFEQEHSRALELPYANNMLSEDGLFTAVRQVLRPLLSGTVPLLTGTVYSRLNLLPVQTATAAVKEETARAKTSHEKLGTVWTVTREVTVRQPSHERRYSFVIEEAYPHRILSWTVEVKDGVAWQLFEKATLAKTDRKAYWQMQGSEYTHQYGF